MYTDVSILVDADSEDEAIERAKGWAIEHLVGPGHVDFVKNPEVAETQTPRGNELINSARSYNRNSFPTHVVQFDVHLKPGDSWFEA